MGSRVANLWVCGACSTSSLNSYGGKSLQEENWRRKPIGMAISIGGGGGEGGRGNRRRSIVSRSMIQQEEEEKEEEEEEKKKESAGAIDGEISPSFLSTSTSNSSSSTSSISSASSPTTSISSSSSSFRSQSKGFGLSNRRDESKGGNSKKAAKKSSSKQKGKTAGREEERGSGRITVSKSIDQSVKNVERMMGPRKIGKNQSIDLDEASRGRVDFAEVDSWATATGDETDLDNLKVRSFSPSFTPADGEGLFYEQLVRRLQLLESKGEISVARGKPLPSFERWRFRESTYLRFLADQFAVHDALETVIEKFELLCNPQEGVVDGSTHAKDSEANTVQPIEGMPPSKAAKAIATFGRRLGIFRSQALSADITAMRRVMMASNDYDYELPERTTEMLPLPTTQTAAYAKYIQLIGNQGIEADTVEAEKAQHRLLAHIFAVHVAHLTTGMRVGAKAVEVLPALQKSGAVCFYRDYPSEVPDPLRTFMEAMNYAGQILGGEESREQVMSELLKALQKTSLLLSVIAVEEEKEGEGILAVPA